MYTHGMTTVHSVFGNVDISCEKIKYSLNYRSVSLEGLAGYPSPISYGDESPLAFTPCYDAISDVWEALDLPSTGRFSSGILLTVDRH